MKSTLTVTGTCMGIYLHAITTTELCVGKNRQGLAAATSNPPRANPHPLKENNIVRAPYNV